MADLAATLLFAIEGALLGAAVGLSIFGVFVVSFISSLGGGIVRDLLIHATPPAALHAMAYPVTAFLGGLLVVGGYDILHEIPGSIRIPLDAAALGLFCAAGAAKTLDHAMKPLTAVLMGTISATGGGVIRDILIHQVPVALRVDIYAIAAALGATVVVAGVKLGLPRPATLLLGITACFGLRVVSVVLGWELPQLTG